MKAYLASVIVLILICTGAALALDPPPTEEACANENGAAYGLCNAYCEAMDCDGEPEASATACSKVQDKYTQITGHGLPCEVADCPCSAIPEWNAALAGNIVECINNLPDSLQLRTATGVFVQVTGNECMVFEPPGAPDSRPVTSAQRAACIDLLTPLCGSG
ncbi:MAG TPA: hypothetical protein VFR31_19460 [Thermoanaerobaculia bacterium]|nr:hypothetical protein [Thermoanaerobaculia bacterium]